MRSLRTILVAALLLLAPAAYAEVHVQAACDVTTTASQCTFSNTGADAGSGCATVVLTHHATHQVMRSATVCSGLLQPAATHAPVPLMFVDNVVQICEGPAPGGLAANCDLRVEMSDVQMDGAAAAGAVGFVCGGLMWLLVLASAIWVYIDAKKRGFSNPASWGFGTFFVWIVVFPWYLVRRNRPSPDSGNPPGGYGPPGGGFPPQGGGYPSQGGGYPPQGGGFPPQGGGYPPTNFGGGYPPQGGNGPQQ